ncbi:phage tail family protein [Bacillus licheniformis]|uniref:phage tail family protein n=1 Tax=Bacillus TaxID=1386 RepID=UPI0002E530DF|nr:MULTISPECIES: phage tail family protein [Bacillus]AWV40359.1 phage tail family protein [Bacillus licheniformis]AZN79847.1 phage tail family protein [Bacillus licheniformis]KAA0807349.1 phage tail family protein [Bacillus licheniformis]KAA0819686.1 phage tail family protein [Bacillus licheniformis]KAA0820810.1 phage tail family protein [Bacillus licheniformis]
MAYLTIIKNGETIDHRKYGLKLLSFRKESLTHRTNYEEVDGRHGTIDTGTTFGERKLKAKFKIQGVDHLDYQLVIDEVYALFACEEPIELIDSRQPGKVWTVKPSSTFEPEDVNPRTGTFEIEFTSPLPFASSVGSTLDPFTFGENIWQIGQGLIPADELVYIHRTKKFRIYNAGNVTVDPCNEMPLNIVYSGSSTNFAIKNITTDQTVSYNGTTKSTDKIKLEGLRHLKNGISVYGNTNRGYISLKPGWNDIELSGTSGSFEISFDFFFFYK